MELKLNSMMGAPTEILYPVSDAFDLSTDTSLPEYEKAPTLTITRSAMNTDEYYLSKYIDFLNSGGKRKKRVAPRSLKERKARRLKRKQRVSCNKR